MSRLRHLALLPGAPRGGCGIQLLDFDPDLAGAIWYPCAGEPKPVPLGSLTVGPVDTLMGVKDCPIADAKLPLIILSHGRGAYFGAHHDTAEALADAGFVVAAINYPGDNGNDLSKSDDLSAFASRPVDTIRLLDFVLHGWKDSAVVDPARVGFFGFSKGGYTGFVLMGVTPDFNRFARFCREKADVCERLHNGEVVPNLPSDARIKAAIIVDPMSVVFTRDNLAAIHVPLQFWRSELGGPGVGDGSGNARIADSLPGKPEIHVLPAGHFTFWRRARRSLRRPYRAFAPMCPRDSTEQPSIIISTRAWCGFFKSNSPSPEL